MELARDPRTTRRWVLLTGFVLLLLALNVIAVGVAYQDKSWTAFGIAILYGPLCNALIGLVSLGLFVAVDGFRWWQVGVCLFIPFFAVVADYLIIGRFPLHGC